MEIEAVVLTGGASRRMGFDKSKLQIAGEESALRIARLLKEIGLKVTIFGPDGQADVMPNSGPLAALANYIPKTKWVFVASCDLPLFDVKIVLELKKWIESYDAALPVIDGRAQPFCGLYSQSAISKAAEFDAIGETRVMKWIDSLNVKFINQETISASGLNPDCVRGANTPEEWSSLVSKIQ